MDPGLSRQAEMISESEKFVRLTSASRFSKGSKMNGSGAQK